MCSPVRARSDRTRFEAAPRCERHQEAARTKEVLTAAALRSSLLAFSVWLSQSVAATASPSAARQSAPTTALVAPHWRSRHFC